MVEAVILGAKIATDIGITTLVNCGARQLTAGCTMNILQRITLCAAELAIAGVIAEKTNVYIENSVKTFDEYMAQRKELSKWTSGGRTDYGK